MMLLSACDFLMVCDFLIFPVIVVDAVIEEHF